MALVTQTVMDVQNRVGQVGTNGSDREKRGGDPSQC